eukprot:3985940-Prorocentrum_lima.AAC.1
MEVQIVPKRLLAARSHVRSPRPTRSQTTMSSTPPPAAEVFDDVLAALRSEMLELLPQEGPPTEEDFDEIDT